MIISEDQLLRELGRVFMLAHRQLDRAMTARGASLARTKLMLYINRYSGQARAADIAELFGLAPRTVTEGLDALERDGFISRAPDPADRRVKRITITQEGKRAIAATEPLRHDLVRDICRDLTEADRQHMYESLMKMAGAMEPHGFGTDTD